MPSPPATAVRVGVTAAVVLLATVGVMIASGEFDAYDFLRAGRRGPSAELVTADFGDRFEIPSAGYDGQQTYAIARTFPDLDAAAAHLDVPRYRLMRILEPALASPAGKGTTLVLALLLLGALGLGLLCGSVADLAARHGRSPLVGYLAAVPAAAPVLVLTVEPLAYGVAFLGLALVDRGRPGRAAVCFAFAALTRETSLVVAAAAAVGLWVKGRRRAALGVAAPAVALTAAWYVVLGALVDPAWPDMTQILGILDVPGDRAMLGLVVIALSALGAWWWRAVPHVWPIAAVFGLWVLVDKPDIIEWLALPRVSIPGIVLGLAGPSTRSPVRVA